MHDQYDIMVNIKCDQHTKKSPIIILLIVTLFPIGKFEYGINFPLKLNKFENRHTKIKNS